MKKGLLLWVLCLISMVTFAQVDLQTITFQTEDPSTTTTYTFTSPVAQIGGNVFVPLSDYAHEGVNGDRYWDLTSYVGLKFDLTFSSGDVGKTAVLRVVYVGNNLSAKSIYKSVNIATENITVIFNFSTDGFETNKVWGIKTPASWDGNSSNITATEEFIVNSIMALNDIPNAIENVKVMQDPDRLVNVYSLTGALVKSKVKYIEATNGLNKGIYIVDGKKLFVTGNR